MGMSEQIQNQQKQAEQWFKELRNQMVGAIQKIDGSIFHYFEDNYLRMDYLMTKGQKK